MTETSNRIVAIVNEEVITEADVARRLTSLLEDLSPQADAEGSPEAMRRAALQQLIDQRLLVQEAIRRGLSVSREEVAERLGVLHRRFGSEEALRQDLEEAGLSLGGFKRQIREQLLVQRLIDQAIRSRIAISPSELAQALEALQEGPGAGELVEVFHILVRVEETRSEAEARSRAQDIYQALVAGGAFEELATRYSDDPHAEQGGAMGWVRRGFLMPELDTVVFTLEEGAFSRPIQSALGFHLVKVGGRRASSPREGLDAKQAAEQGLFQRKFNEAFTQWISELRRQAYIEIRLED